MEVFSIFATLSLKDLLSGPLAHIRQGLGSLETGISSLGQRMGNLALAMAPVAIGAGAVLGAFGKCVATAAGFEDQMAKVGAISRANAQDLAALEAKARELGATTQFTAVQVGEAEQFLAMAGFSAKDNIAALPGVLNLAAATATDLGRAADISSDILGAFGMQASEMGTVADVLAMTCSTANTDMEKLGDTMKYVAPVARTAGLSIQETAAMAGLLGNVGIKGSQAGTTLKAMLNKLAAPASEGAKALAKLGIATKDAAGNLRSPVQILAEMSGKLKEMGTAEQMAAMKAVVGEEAVAGFAELIKQGGIGELEKYINILNKSGGACDEMAKTMNNTLAGSLRGLGSAWESLQISIGKIFIPVARKVVDVFTGILRVFDKFSQSKIGQAILKVAGALATAVVAITAFSAGMWAFTKIAPMISGVFGTIKAAMLGLGAPVWAIIAAIGVLYVIWKNDFGGITTVVSGWWKKIQLVFQGVCAVFDTLKGTSGELRGELAKEIKANGLVGIVTTVGKVVFRIREFFSGIWEGLNFDKVTAAFMPAVLKIRDLFDTVGNALGKLFGWEIDSSAASWKNFGQIIGSVVSFALEGLATGITIVVNGIDSLMSFLRMICALFTGDFATAAEMAGNIWQNFCDSLMSIADWLGIGDWIRNAWQSVTDFFANLNFIDAIKGAWDSVFSFLAAINPLTLFRKAWAKVINFFSSLNLAAGIRNAWNRVTAFLSSINPLNLIRAAWQRVTGWLASLNLAGGVKKAWDKVKAFLSALNPLAWISAAWNGLTSFLEGIRPLEYIRKGWEAVKNFCSGLNPLDWIRNAWQGVVSWFSSLNLVDGIKNAWNNVLSFLSGLNPLGYFQSAWTAVTDYFSTLNLSDGIRQAWDSVTAFLSGINPIELISQAFSGLTDFFANLNLTDGISQAWSRVTEFFSGLNLFESGARLIETLKEGVLSMASSLIDGVKGVFSSIRNLLPFSDAKEGPLSELTLSGSRIMTTLGEGVNQGKDSLKESVSGALGEVNGQLQNFQDGMKPLENLTPKLPQSSSLQIDAPEVPVGQGLPLKPDLDLAQIPDLPSPAPLSLAYGEVPDLPSGVLKDALLQFASPELPEMNPVSVGFEQPLQISQDLALTGPVSPDISPLAIDMPEMPELPKLGLESPKLPELAPLAPPVIHDINPARIEFGAMPDLPELEIRHAIEPTPLSGKLGAIPDVNIPEIPEPKAPQVAIPDAPVGFPQDNAKRAETGQPQNTQHISITIGQITLPDVQNAESFISSLKSALQNEIGQFEGATA